MCVFLFKRNNMNISQVDYNIQDEITNRLLQLEKDNPASIYYNRHLERPDISLLKIIKNISICLISCAAVTILLCCLNVHICAAFIFSFLILLAYIIMHLKQICIYLILLYQRYAPASLRMKCRYEPSCSQYMLLAIEKYGLRKGVALGIKRLKRCKIGNGGYDFP